MFPSNFELCQLPNELPWQGGAYLLLDGISVEDLPRRLYEWSERPTFEPLYLNTRWSGLTDVSPCLISLSGSQDPIVGHFLNQAEREWGYLLFCRAPQAGLLEHLRWLVSVRHPLGEELLLRLADPAVISVLLDHAVQNADATLFGPVEQIVTPDVVHGYWHHHRRPGNPPFAIPATPYPLSEEQLALLGEVSFRSIVRHLDEHMRDYFPSYQSGLAGSTRWQHLHELASRAYEQGFNSERDITLYANIFGFLGDDALARYPNIQALLSKASEQTATQRIEQAAELAREHAEQMKRNSL